MIRIAFGICLFASAIAGAVDIPNCKVGSRCDVGTLRVRAPGAVSDNLRIQSSPTGRVGIWAVTANGGELDSNARIWFQISGTYINGPLVGSFVELQTGGVYRLQIGQTEAKFSVPITSNVASGSNALTINAGATISIGNGTSLSSPSANIWNFGNTSNVKSNSVILGLGGGVRTDANNSTANSAALILKALTTDSASTVAFDVASSYAITTNQNTVRLVRYRTATDATPVDQGFVYANGKLGWPMGDSSASPGAATIDKVSGRAAVAASAASVVITNATSVAGSQIIVTPLDLDATCTSFRAVAFAGSFIVSMNAACTAVWKFAFLVTN